MMSILVMLVLAETPAPQEPAPDARAAAAEKREAEYQAWLAQMDAEGDALDEQERKAEASLKKKCGKDYMRVEIGMSFERVRECAGPFERVAQMRRNSDGAVATVYDAPGGRVYVVAGKVSAWSRRR